MAKSVKPNEQYLVHPITPKEVIKNKIKYIPDEVIESFNELIAKNFYGNSATILQKDVLQLISQKFGGKYTSQDVYDNHWLDVEDIYRKVGWKVEYDSPAYCESYEPSFKFTKNTR